MTKLPPKIENAPRGIFGYEGAVCDTAIRANNVEMLKECVEKGFIDSTSITLVSGYSMVEYAKKYNAPDCAEYLISIG